MLTINTSFSCKDAVTLSVAVLLEKGCFLKLKCQDYVSTVEVGPVCLFCGHRFNGFI